MFHTNLWVSSTMISTACLPHQQEKPSGGYFTCRKQGSNPHKDNLLPPPTPLPEVQVLSEATPSSEVGSSPTTPRQVHQFHDGVPTTSSLGPPGRSWKEEIILLIQRKQMFQFGHLGWRGSFPPLLRTSKEASRTSSTPSEPLVLLISPIAPNCSHVEHVNLKWHISICGDK